MTAVDEHHGQHDRCRACGTSPRSRGTNPRGLRPPDPPAEQQPNPSGALTEWTGPELDPSAGPVIDDPTEARSRLERARQLLADTRKPPMGDPPISTRGAIR